MITFKHRGNFEKTESFLKRRVQDRFKTIIERYCQEGVAALEAATPIDSGITANSWSYQIIYDPKGFRIYWTNTSVDNGILVAILIQYGHGTRSGSFVQGRDFINPVMRPIFDKIADGLWKEVTTS